MSVISANLTTYERSDNPTIDYENFSDYNPSLGYPYIGLTRLREKNTTPGSESNEADNCVFGKSTDYLRCINSTGACEDTNSRLGDLAVKISNLYEKYIFRKDNIGLLVEDNIDTLSDCTANDEEENYKKYLATNILGYRDRDGLPFFSEGEMAEREDSASFTNKPVKHFNLIMDLGENISTGNVIGIGESEDSGYDTIPYNDNYTTKEVYLDFCAIGYTNNNTVYEGVSAFMNPKYNKLDENDYNRHLNNLCDKLGYVNNDQTTYVDYDKTIQITDSNGASTRLPLYHKYRNICLGNPGFLNIADSINSNNCADVKNIFYSANKDSFVQKAQIFLLNYLNKLIYKNYNIDGAAGNIATNYSRFSCHENEFTGFNTRSLYNSLVSSNSNLCYNKDIAYYDQFGSSINIAGSGNYNNLSNFNKYLFNMYGRSGMMAQNIELIPTVVNDSSLPCNDGFIVLINNSVYENYMDVNARILDAYTKLLESLFVIQIENNEVKDVSPIYDSNIYSRNNSINIYNLPYVYTTSYTSALWSNDGFTYDGSTIVSSDSDINSEFINILTDKDYAYNNGIYTEIKERLNASIRNHGSERIYLNASMNSSGTSWGYSSYPIYMNGSTSGVIHMENGYYLSSLALFDTNISYFKSSEALRKDYIEETLDLEVGGTMNRFDLLPLCTAMLRNTLDTGVSLIQGYNENEDNAFIENAYGISGNMYLPEYQITDLGNYGISERYAHGDASIHSHYIHGYPNKIVNTAIEDNMISYDPDGWKNNYVLLKRFGVNNASGAIYISSVKVKIEGDVTGNEYSECKIGIGEGENIEWKSLGDAVYNNGVSTLEFGFDIETSPAFYMIDNSEGDITPVKKNIGVCQTGFQQMLKYCANFYYDKTKYNFQNCICGDAPDCAKYAPALNSGIDDNNIIDQYDIHTNTAGIYKDIDDFAWNLTKIYGTIPIVVSNAKRYKTGENDILKIIGAEVKICDNSVVTLGKTSVQPMIAPFTAIENMGLNFLYGEMFNGQTPQYIKLHEIGTAGELGSSLLLSMAGNTNYINDSSAYFDEEHSLENAYRFTNHLANMGADSSFKSHAVNSDADGCNIKTHPAFLANENNSNHNIICECGSYNFSKVVDSSNTSRTIGVSKTYDNAIEIPSSQCSFTNIEHDDIGSMYYNVTVGENTSSLNKFFNHDSSSMYVKYTWPTIGININIDTNNIYFNNELTSTGLTYSPCLPANYRENELHTLIFEIDSVIYQQGGNNDSVNVLETSQLSLDIENSFIFSGNSNLWRQTNPLGNISGKQITTNGVKTSYFGLNDVFADNEIKEEYSAISSLLGNSVNRFVDSAGLYNNIMFSYDDGTNNPYFSKVGAAFPIEIYGQENVTQNYASNNMFYGAKSAKVKYVKLNNVLTSLNVSDINLAANNYISNNVDNTISMYMFLMDGVSDESSIATNKHKKHFVCIKFKNTENIILPVAAVINIKDQGGANNLLALNHYFPKHTTILLAAKSNNNASLEDMENEHTVLFNENGLNTPSHLMKDVINIGDSTNKGEIPIKTADVSSGRQGSLNRKTGKVDFVALSENEYNSLSEAGKAAINLNNGKVLTDVKTICLFKGDSPF